MKFAIVLLAAVASVAGLPPPDLWPFGRIPNGRIVGGSEATPHSHPYIVDMRRGSHYCGGSIITPDWVVTAAHCSTAAPANYQLVAGDHNINTDDPDQQTRQVDMIIRHPQYGSGFQYQYDIALMHVSPPFELNDNVQIIEIPSTPGLDPGPVLTTSGWGALTEGGSSPNVLYEVDVPFVTDASCREAYGQNSISVDMICAGEAGKDACQGDSGGPLTAYVGGVPQLFGIVSWGQGCARPGYPGVFTESSYFKDWVEQAIIPPEEDNSTFVEQNEGCGGSLFGSSGQVSYKLGMELGPNERCTWSLRANDVTGIRFEVLEFGNTGDKLYITEVDNDNGRLTTTTQITGTGVFSIVGPNAFLTLESDEDFTSNEGFRIHFYGTGYSGATGAKHINLAGSGSTGALSHPSDGSQYTPEEFVTAVINSENANGVLIFTRMGMEGSGTSCTYDWLNVYTWNAGAYELKGTWCGTTLPPSQITNGPVILTMRTDFSIQGPGWAVTWH